MSCRHCLLRLGRCELCVLMPPLVFAYVCMCVVSCRNELQAPCTMPQGFERCVCVYLVCVLACQPETQASQSISCAKQAVLAKCNSCHTCDCAQVQTAALPHGQSKLDITEDEHAALTELTFLNW